MCLDLLYKTNFQKTKIAYQIKIYNPKTECISNLYYNTDKKMKLGEKHETIFLSKDKTNRVEGMGWARKPYCPGFHCFEYKNDAIERIPYCHEELKYNFPGTRRKAVVVKVKCYGVHTQGAQWNKKVIVCDRIKLIEVIK